MNIKSLVEKIHKSNLYGTIYEMGAGVGIAHNLMKYAGASKTIYSAHSLYNKRAFIDQFNIFYTEGETNLPRAVSKEYCDLLFKSSQDIPRDANFELVSTFQLPEEAGKTKHGWIGLHILDENKVRFYHMTFPPGMSRKEAIDEVALAGLNILNARNEHCMFSSYIDRVDNRVKLDLELTLQAFTSSPDRNKIGVFAPTVSSHQPWVVRRIEKYLRDQNNILVYKGSFNPWHAGHQHTMENSVELYPKGSTSQMLCISVDTYGKGEMTADGLLNRIENLKNLGYPIAVITKPFFSDLTDLILDKVTGTLFLTMGDDVMDKIVEMNDQYIFSHEKVSAVVVRRHNDGTKNYNQIPGVLYIDEAYPESISSTQIRNSTKEDNGKS